MAGLVSRGLRTICFAKSRKAAELIHRFTADRVDTATAARLAPYRAGYTPAQRREIERRLMDGELLGVSATDALELGIDIGELDCAISVGFPGTVASLRQQWGRAGRRGHGLAVLIASEDALDQFFMREPEALLGRRVEATRLDHANPRILDPHVYAAAYEGPIRPADADTLGPEALERAAAAARARADAGRASSGRAATTPPARVSLRSGDQDSFTIVDGTTGAILGLVERERAYSSVHEGAVYLHLGEQYLVRALDVGARTAVVEPATVDWYTQVKKDTETAIEQPLRVGARGRRRPAVRPRLGDRAGDRVPAQGDPRTARRSTWCRLILPEVDLRDRGGLVLPRRRAARGARGDAEAARGAACGRARADLAAAAVGDVRPLGHRRALDEPPLPDRAADGVRLRRPRGRRRHHRARVRQLRRLGRGHRAPARRAARARTAARRACRARSAGT